MKRGQAAVVKAMLSRQTLTRLEDVHESVAWLHQNTASGQASPGSGPYRTAVCGTPSATVPFMIKSGGHHLACQCTSKDARASVTPAFSGTEPKTFDLDCANHEALKLKAESLATASGSLITAEDTAAKLPPALNDILRSAQVGAAGLAYATTKDADGASAHFGTDAPRVLTELTDTHSGRTRDPHLLRGLHRDKNHDYGSTNPAAERRAC